MTPDYPTQSDPRAESRSKLPTYALITPARNEAANIRRALDSVVRQAVLPVKWVIVSDGSTDGTDEIVKEYAAGRDWIELIRMPERAERHFGGKADCFNEGYARLKSDDFDVVGNLDADLSFEEGYFAFLMGKFAANPTLGVAGTPFHEGEAVYDYRFTSIEHVSGACQLFRRTCFEQIGGYLPIKGGGIDLVAVITARMKGWETRTFTEMFCEHHKQTQLRGRSRLKSKFRTGYQDYLLGMDPLWMVCRSLYQMTKSPLLGGGSSLLLGYFWGLLKQAERPVSKELVAFRRKEQMRRLKLFAGRIFGLGGMNRGGI